jgi:acetyl esterase/lipase
MPSTQHEQFVQLLRGARVTPDLPVDDARAGYDASGSVIPLPDGTETSEIDLGGVPAERVHVGDVDDRRAVVWFHGGGYVIGSTRSHRPLAAALSATSGLPVLLVDYRRAPEHPYPAAIDDATAAIDAAIDANPGGVAVGGDSAGGGLALAAVTARLAAGEAPPAALALVSPWLDLTGDDDPDQAATDADPVLSPELLEHWSDLYCGDADRRDPLVSPLYADLTGLPPLLVHASSAELLADDARRLAERSRQAGCDDVTLDIADDLVHHWHVWVGLFPEADESLAQIGRWLRGQLVDAAASHE